MNLKEIQSSNLKGTDKLTSLGQQVFNISMAQVESEVEPDCVGNDVWRKSVALICIHRRIISFRRVYLSVPHETTRVRERGMRKFKSVKQAQRFLGAHSAVSNLFNPGRH
jgi:transposase-like protein